MSEQVEGKMSHFKDAVQHLGEKDRRSMEERSHTQGKIQQVGISLEPDAREVLLEQYAKCESNYLRACRVHENTGDFETMRSLGQGSFGVVRLVRRKRDGAILALKQMPKELMKKKNQRNRAINERFVLSSMDNAKGVVKLESTFQDPLNLYLCMEFLPGGDFMNLLMCLDILSEEQTRFCISEIVEAVGEVHSRGYVHRDLKPDNIVMDADGHLKLLDFGLCSVNPNMSMSGTDKLTQDFLSGEISTTEMDITHTHTHTHTNKKPHHLKELVLRSAVGTPHYMSPEVFRCCGYNRKTDWWSVGIIMYESVFGGVPFDDTNNSISNVSFKITNWKYFLHYPTHVRNVSSNALDCIARLLCEAEDRMDYDDIRIHPFFEGIPWGSLHLMKSPVRRKIKDPVDSSNFKSSPHQQLPPPVSRGSPRKDMKFVGYTYKKDVGELKPTVDKVIDRTKNINKNIIYENINKNISSENINKNISSENNNTKNIKREQRTQ
eukprot:GHVR01080108.1.p1 GENE.GHVR01080108.1~~GHVR01080108.1.p1  ORF type:complete len:493 (+),score=136.99 GHVR01080108.1:58-1536(+)